MIMRKTMVMLLSVVLLCIQFASAEDVSVCTCCNCHIVHDKQDDVDTQTTTTLTDEEAYSAWFATVHPLLYSCYADSTWIMNWFVTTIEGDLSHLKVNYLLKEDMLSITAEEMNEFVPIRSDYKENIYHMHSYIHVTPATLATVRALKATMVKSVPAEYEYLDSLIVEMITDVELLRTELIDHIKENGTMKDFATDNNSTKEKVKTVWNRIDWIHSFIK